MINLSMQLNYVVVDEVIILIYEIICFNENGFI
jgi:hypothetical protein